MGIDPLVKSCLWMIDEASDEYIIYGFSSDDSYRISYNLVYNFGGLVDRIHEITFVSGGNMDKSLNALDWLYLGS